VTGGGDFGTLNLSTGTFNRIAVGDVISNAGIDETPAGNLYEYTGANQLFAINPATGATTLIGTGSIPGFGSGGSFFTVGGLTTGAFYAMNWNGDLYSIDLTTGATTLSGSTGINLQSGGGVCEETGLSGSATTLYYVTGLQPGCITSNQALYSINPSTAVATVIGSTFGANDPVIGTAYDNGTLYGFAAQFTPPSTFSNPQILQISTTTGNATVVAGTSEFFSGGVPLATPEPSGITLLGAGLLGLLGFSLFRGRLA
jgi:hypothetical protein